ncbi:16S rRNA (adenine(1518)-N(6)/adenine(1519)-N(6))-dimethyltransferase RsmA [Candidatus Pelagibacter sp.]|nr:16S rRNA (adenine(1518)-N(6)/adenine(1519)-N(6))-dimethyltransferase RsmA [Candidatus Pelagibacter sp.]
MIKAKKSLGQNFLVDNKIIKKIVDTTKIEEKEILEIGPGTGNLTSEILKKNPKKVYVVEKDNELSVSLKERFKNQIILYNEDILNFNEQSLSKNKLIVFGNLPYNISTEILCNWIINLSDDEYWFSELILMFQKEVADRIIAKFNTSSYGRLSILTNWKLCVNKICDIGPECFSPRPKIDSSLLHFKPKNNFIKVKNPKNIEIISRIFFSNRRKMLKKPFNQLFNGDQNILDNLKINLNLRPHNLDFDTYYKLVLEYEKLKS